MIRVYMRDRKLSQAAIGKRIGLSQGDVSAWMTDRKWAGLDVLEKASRLLEKAGYIEVPGYRAVEDSGACCLDGEISPTKLGRQKLREYAGLSMNSAERRLLAFKMRRDGKRFHEIARVVGMSASGVWRMCKR